MHPSVPESFGFACLCPIIINSSPFLSLQSNPDWMIDYMATLILSLLPNSCGKYSLKHKVFFTYWLQSPDFFWPAHTAWHCLWTSVMAQHHGGSWSLGSSVCLQPLCRTLPSTACIFSAPYFCLSIAPVSWFEVIHGPWWLSSLSIMTLWLFQPLLTFPSLWTWTE